LFIQFGAVEIAIAQKEVAAIVNRTCMPCHNLQDNPGIVFKELSDLRLRKTMIEYVLAEGIMPKTHSDFGYSVFHNEVYISENEKQQIIDYLNSSDTRNAKLAYKPDNINAVKNTLAFSVQVVSKGTGNDNYAVVKIPYQIKHDSSWVTGYRVKTSSPKDFHHIGIFFLKKDNRNKNLEEGLRNFYYGSKPNKWQEDTLERLYHLMKLIPNTERFFWDWMIFKTEWQIGASAFYFPQGSGFFLPKEGAILLNNIHMRPTAKDKSLTIEIELFYKKQPPSESKYLYVVDLANTPGSRLHPPLKIQAGKKQQHVLSTVLPDDMELHTVSPHMHFLGKRFLSFAVSPQGDTTNIIRINNWDPDWMKTYQFQNPLHLVKGSVFYCIGDYDNTSDNPRNPNIPPKDVGNSMLFREEMLNMIISFTLPD
jgi:hypothetical protein